MPRGVRGGSKRPGGRAQAKSKPSEPATQGWQDLISSSVLFCNVVCEVDEEAGDICEEQAAIFASAQKKKLSFEHRMGVLDAMSNVVQDFMESLMDLDEEKSEEHQIGVMLEKFFTSTLAYLIEAAKSCSTDAPSSNESEEEPEQECTMILRLLDILIQTSVLPSDYAKKHFTSHYEPIVEFMLAVAQSPIRADYMREAACGVLTNLAEGHPTPMSEGKLLSAVVDACYHLCSDKEDEELDPNRFSSQNLGTSFLDVLVMRIKPVKQLVLDKSTAILAGNEEDKFKRKAALVCLAVLPESAKDVSRSHLSSIIPLLQTQFHHKEPIVRSGAYICLAEYVEFIQPEMSKYHAQLFQQIIDVLHDEKETMLVKVKAAIPLIQLCLHVGDEEVNEKEVSNEKGLMNSLLHLVQSIVNKDKHSEEEIELANSLVIAIRSIVSSKETKFVPFAGRTLEMLFALAKAKSEEEYPLSASAISCIGEVAVAIGKDALLSHMQRISSLLFESVEEEHYGLRAATHATWAQLASVLQADLLPYLEKLVPVICRPLAADYGQEEEEEEEQEEEEDEVKEEDEEILEERKFALICYKCCVEAVGPAFLPFHERCFEVVFDNAREYSDEIKVHVAALLGSFPSLYPVSPASPSQEHAWTPGTSIELTVPQKKLFASVTQILFFFIHYSQDQEVVAESCNAFGRLLKVYGQGIIQDEEQNSKTMITLINKLLTGKAACQQDGAVFGGEEEDGEEEENEEEEEEEEDDEENEEDGEEEDGAKKSKKKGAESEPHEHGPNCHHDEEEEEEEGGIDSLSIATLDLLIQFARTRGPAFFPQLETVFPALLKSFKDEAFAGYSLGGFADIVDAVGPSSYVLLPKAFPLLLKSARQNQEDVHVLRNISYAVGVLFLKAGATEESMKEYVKESAEVLVKAFAFVHGKIEKEQKKDKSETSGAAAAEAGRSDAKVDEVISGLNKLDLNENEEDEDDLLGCQDNIISAIGKLIMVSDSLPEVKVEELVPVFISGLPLQNDIEESNYVYSTCIKMIKTFPSSHPNVIEPHYSKLISVFASVLADKNIPDKLKGFVATGVKELEKVEVVTKEIASWSEEKRTKFESDVKAASEVTTSGSAESK